MSKSPNLFLPALGGAALVLGAGYGIATNQWADSKVAAMESAVEAAKAEAEQAAVTANSELARATELEAEALEIQSEARRQLATAGSGSISEPAPLADDGYGLGRAALPEEVAAWDIKVMPDGRGLPKGRGDVLTGEEVFAEKCASCHGDFAEGVDNWPVLAGGFDTLDDKDPVKTVGSYWPYLSTVWDYVHRSMPFGNAQTVTADETYAIVAYILYSNDLVDEDFELSSENFSEFSMYNADGFVLDDRAETEYAQWTAEPCMENCKESVEITMHASVLDVTPDEGSEDDSASVSGTSAETTLASGEYTGGGVQKASAETEAADGPDPELVAAGEKTFRKCKACHQIGDGAKNRTGPHLNGLIGRTVGGVDGFKYSNVFQDAASEGRTWDTDSLAEFLAKPKAYMKGTKMAFAGLKSEEDIAAVTAYIEASGQ